MRANDGILVEEDDVGFPDFAGDDPDDGDAAKLARLPAQLVVLPQLKPRQDNSR